ncbi:MAG: GNAT family N-acetyltransferase [Aliarcobacter sp.]|nr:GNAT family N-acetyltransferase [Aliarcobacter sp.]
MITQAKKKNDLSLAILILNAIGTIANTLTGEDEKDKILETLDLYISMDVNRLSYNNIWIYELENEIAGLIIAYNSNKIKELDTPILNHLKSKNMFLKSFDKECFKDEFYIDTVSVFEKFQGRGIKKELFVFIEKRQKIWALKKEISLLKLMI